MQRDRFAGYCDGLEAAQPVFDPAPVGVGDLTCTGGYHATVPLLPLPHPPIAIISANDLTADGVIRAARERRIVVGRDLAVARYDGTEESEHAQPLSPRSGSPSM